MLTFGRLLKRHDRKGFDCGNEALNDYLQRRASQEMKCGDAVCHVLTEDDGNEILGFFTLSSASISSTGLRTLCGSKFFYAEAGFFLLGRLAVSKKAQGRGIGTLLVNEAIRITVQSDIGAHGLIVDLKDEQLFDFYKRFGFLSFPDNKLRMVLIVRQKT